MLSALINHNWYYRVFKYENGNLYVKKSTTYLAFRSEKNEVLYKKVKK